MYNLQVMQNLVMVTKNFNQEVINSKLDSLTTAHYAAFTAKIK
jgi:hypothetical protein